MVRAFLLTLFAISPLGAVNYGTQGHVFEIAEPDLLTQIEKRLQTLNANGEIKRHQDILVAATQKSIRNPKPVSSITKATSRREYTFDPSIIVPYNLKDHQGQIFQKAGTRNNPLKLRPLSSHLLFIDGEDAHQVAWAKQYQHKSLVVLVSGSPFDFMEDWGRAVYFDQDGRLTSKLGIQHVPAVVEQKDLLLHVTELPEEEIR